MACFHPLAAIKYDSKYNRISKDGHEYTPLRIGSARSEFHDFVDENTGEFNQGFYIPCGTCAGCRMDKSREWADRCTLEALMCPPDSCWFVTLTIDDLHMEQYRVFEKADGTIVDGDIFTLEDSLLTNFKKKLLAQYDYEYSHKGVKFFACGEYGGQSHRPHFHILLFNAPLKDIDFWSYHHVGPYKIPIFRSKFIESKWKLGYVWIERFDWNNAAYVARYTQKKAGLLTRDAEKTYIDNGLLPEFIRMSRKPGIGVSFFEKNIDKFYKPCYREVYDENIGETGVQEITATDVYMPAYGDKPAKVLKIPRLFDVKFSKMLSDEMTEWNLVLNEGSHRQLAKEKLYDIEEKILAYNRYKQGKKESAEIEQKVLLSRTDLDRWEYQDQTEILATAAYKKLKRNL